MSDTSNSKGRMVSCLRPRWHSGLLIIEYYRFPRSARLTLLKSSRMPDEETKDIIQTKEHIKGLNHSPFKPLAPVINLS